MPYDVAQISGAIHVARRDPLFVDAVLTDLMRITATSAGRVLLRKVYDDGYTILIEKPDPPTDPPNAWVETNKTEGTTELVITYDPADWPCPVHPGSPASDVLLGLLLREIFHQFPKAYPQALPRNEKDRTTPSDTTKVISQVNVTI
jgi:hypothetical protein